MANRLGFGAFVTKSQLEAATLMATRNSPAVQAEGNIAMFDWDATGALANTLLPVLVLGGSADIVTKSSASETLATSAPTAILEIAEDAGHLGFVEREERYHAAIRRFVERCFSNDAIHDDSAPLRPANEILNGFGPAGR